MYLHANTYMHNGLSVGDIIYIIKTIHKPLSFMDMQAQKHPQTHLHTHTNALNTLFVVINKSPEKTLINTFMTVHMNDGKETIIVILCDEAFLLLFTILFWFLYIADKISHQSVLLNSSNFTFPLIRFCVATYFDFVLIQLVEKKN